MTQRISDKALNFHDVISLESAQFAREDMHGQTKALIDRMRTRFKRKISNGKTGKAQVTEARKHEPHSSGSVEDIFSN
jgi:hypothetical protein